MSTWIKKWSCKQAIFFQFPGDANTKVCSVLDAFCTQELNQKFINNIIINTCDCKPDCLSIEYDLEISLLGSAKWVIRRANATNKSSSIVFKYAKYFQIFQYQSIVAYFKNFHIFDVFEVWMYINIYYILND